MSTILVAIITAMLTSLATETLISPRLEARKRRIQAAHESRDEFTRAIFDLLTYTSRLKNLSLSAEGSTSVYNKLAAERHRWTQHVGAITEDLIDDGFGGTMTYPGWLGRLAGEFAATCRLVWLSERPMPRKIELLNDLAEHAQGLYATAIWRRPWEKPQHKEALQRVIAAAIENTR